MHAELALAALITKPWWELEGVIYTVIFPDGTTSQEWPNRLEDDLCHITDTAEKIFRLDTNKRISGLMPRVVAILRKECFPEGATATTRDILEALAVRGIRQSRIDDVGLFREQFTDEDIEATGLAHIIFAHKSVRIERVSYWLSVHGFDDGSWVSASPCSLKNRVWDNSCDGFAGIVKENNLSDLVESLGIEV